MKENLLSLKEKLVLGTGEIPGTMTKTVISVLFLNFLTDTVHLAPALAGLIFMIGRVWDAVTDPLVGVMSDRTNTRWGRRRPFFLAAAVPLGLSFFLMFFPFQVASETVKMILYTVFYLMYMTAITVYFVPYLCILAEATDNYAERTTISNFRNLFSLIFGLAAVVVTPMLTKSMATPEQGYMVSGLGIGILAGLLAFFMFAAVREREKFAHSKYKGKFFRQMIDTFKNRAFLFMLIIYVGCLATVNVIEATVIYYLKYWLHKGDQLEIVFVLVVISSIATMPLWTFLSKTIGKKKAAIMAIIIWLCTSALWVVLKPSSPNYLLYIVAVLNGVGYGGGRVMPWSMFPDTIDYDEFHSGVRREGIYSGVTTFFMKIGNSISIFLFGLLLQWTGYVDNQVQTGSALVLMRWVLFIVPLFFLTFSLIAAFLYPLSPEKFKEIRAALDGRKREVKQD